MSNTTTDVQSGNQPRERRLLAGKVAIVTGASRGIGAATARAFAEDGAAVVLAARSQPEIAPWPPRSRMPAAKQSRS